MSREMYVVVMVHGVVVLLWFLQGVRLGWVRVVVGVEGEVIDTEEGGGLGAGQPQAYFLDWRISMENRRSSRRCARASPPGA